MTVNGVATKALADRLLRFRMGDDIHLFNDELREWEDYYNYHRSHGALDGQTPYERLMAKSAASLSTKS